MRGDKTDLVPSGPFVHPSRAYSHENKIKNPRKLLARAFELLSSNDYEGLASLCDPLSLRSFKAEMLEEFDYESFDANPMEPRAAPIELTDEQYAEYCKYLDPVRLFQNEFPLLSTVEDLKKLEPVTAFSVWMQGKSRHHPGECDADAEPWKATHNEISWPEYEIVGCVFGTPGVSYVLYRNRSSPATYDGYQSWFASTRKEHREFMEAMGHRGDPSIVTCRRQLDGSWRLIANRGFLVFGGLTITEFRADDSSSYPD